MLQPFPTMINYSDLLPQLSVPKRYVFANQGATNKPIEEDMHIFQFITTLVQSMTT